MFKHKGKNYGKAEQPKDVTAIIRKETRTKYPQYKISGRTRNYNSISITVTAGHKPAYKTPEELNEKEQQAVRKWIYSHGTGEETTAEAMEKAGYSFYNDEIQEMQELAGAIADSYNYSDSNPYADYVNKYFYFNFTVDYSYKVDESLKLAEPKPKQTTKTDTASTEATTDKAYTIALDVDTRDNSPLYLVKFTEHLPRPEYLKVNKAIQGIGGYYSRYKSGFIFKDNPEEALTNLYGTPQSTDTAEDTKPTEPQTEETAETSGAGTAGEQEPATAPSVEITATYHDINEETARQAQQANSFTEYTAGQATAEYKSAIQALHATAQEKATRYPEEAQQIQRLLDRYARQLADWTNRHNRNRASVPSVMIAGAGNFPTRKKQQQNDRESRLMQEYKTIQETAQKLKYYRPSQAIQSNDSQAVQKLKARIESAEESHALMVKINRHWRTHKTLENMDGISDKIKEAAKRNLDINTHQPFPSSTLSNSRQSIRADKKRLEELEALEEMETKTTHKREGLEVVEDTEAVRIRFYFEGKPSAEVREIMKNHSFRWAPSVGAWQRHLNSNGRLASTRALEQIDELDNDNPEGVA